MKEFLSNYIKTYENLEKWIKIVFCLLWDIPANLYRFAKSAQKGDLLGMVIAVILGIFGGWVLFVIDLLCLVFKDKIFWLDDFSDNSADSNSDNSDQNLNA